MFGHSRRVSPKKDMDACKALVQRWTARLATWAQGRPFQRRLRRWNVLTLLGLAGVVLSVAALTMVIDIGKAQVVATEYPHEHRADLFGNCWFYVASAASILGVVLTVFAIGANNSQAAARRAFPNLSIYVYSDGRDEFPRDRMMLVPSAGGMQEAKLSLAWFGLRITNQEPARRASLTFRLRHDLSPRPGLLDGMDEYFFPTADRDLPNAVPVFPERLDELVNLDPEDSTYGEVVFDISPPVGEMMRDGSEGEIVVTDHISRTHARLPARIGGFYSGQQ